METRWFLWTINKLTEFADESIEQLTEYYKSFINNAELTPNGITIKIVCLLEA